MKTLLLFPALCFSLQLCAQSNLLFDTSAIDSNTKLIGRYPQYDKQKKYKFLNFIVEDPATIKKVIASLALGQEGKNAMEDPDFSIALVQNRDEVKRWTINPALKTAMYSGHTYSFDIETVRKLAKKYPFDYRFDRIPFNDRAVYEKYLTKQKENKDFLFDYPPLFKYEGSFEVSFPRNQQFSSPKAISEYLEPLIEKIASKNDYRVTYALNDKNLKDQSQFTMTITGSKKLYNELPLGDLKKETWTPTEENGWLFYRIN